MKAIAVLAALLTPCWLGSADAAGGGSAVGAPSAPITMEVFSDFQCPHCRILFEQTLPLVAQDYARTGKVYLIYREYPLAGNAYSKQAAYLAAAAARVGRYEQVAGALFARQAEWAASGKPEQAALSGLAGADAAKIRALAKDSSVTAEVDKDIARGQSLRINQTPTMIITHRLKQYPLTGSVSYSLLRRFLDELLSK
ncbi:MAG: thioredoxin domain-containing protein [Bryobacterales bacterium]|nr:thioredoxin domain-containing protein [Bryobacterales bacterium]